ncbi:DUF72 domain-containing protein [Terriglobus sp. TAA 43]|uniref:DUF72 domain-containing protein n=1 Tax=Terriglobus sp. TAA 43 TaxID=278961 RepID=UPI000646D476|nr:DUF72 domain-containing protein [Terriglobus sp. TAA 43]
MNIRIGTAGWTLPKQSAALFAEEGSHLERYASRLCFVEVNSSFHRPHRRTTWERWARSVPQDFRFAVKMPKSITHEAKLVNTGARLLPFFEEISGLGEKLGPVLVQLPPKLEFDEGVVRDFFGVLRELYAGDTVCEARHPSWFDGRADRLLREFDIARVAADPPKGSPHATEPAGSAHLRYWRLHGTPRTYYSEYGEAFLHGLAERVRQHPETPVWVVFDNTALGHATPNALRLCELLQSV